MPPMRRTDDGGSSVPALCDFAKRSGTRRVALRVQGEYTALYQRLISAAGSVDIRVMMSYSSTYLHDQASFARAGGTVTLLAPTAYLARIRGYAGPTYIHGKAFLLSAADGTFKGGWVGSTNLGNSSIGRRSGPLAIPGLPPSATGR